MSDDKQRIAHLEMIINEIEGALCNYCNTVKDFDRDTPIALQAESERATFDDLCAAYNLWYERHGEIGDISMKFYSDHERYRHSLSRIASGDYPTIERAIEAAKNEFS